MNGRVERCIRTMKEMLELHDKDDEDGLSVESTKVEEELNDTPHKGIGYLTLAAFHNRGAICQA